MQAGTLNCPSCGAAISSDSTQCQYCGALLQTVACPSCFGMMFRGSRFCPHCGASADAPGVDGAPTNFHCPRCDAMLQVFSPGGTPLDQCPRCGGLWIAAEKFQQICADRVAQAAALALKLPPPMPLDEHVRYRKCPVCSQLMARKNFAQRSGVIIDICRPHGIWFDRDELRRIIEFIRAGGLDRAREIEIQKLESERANLEMQRLLLDLRGTAPDD